MSEEDESVGEAAAKPASGGTEGGGRGRGIALIVLSVLLVAALAAAGLCFWKYHSQRADIDAREEARIAACDYAPKLINFDEQTLDTFIGDVLAGATGDWKDQFGKDAPQYRDLVTRGQLKSQFNDAQCATQSGDTKQAAVVVGVGRSISSVLTQGQVTPGQVAMIMTMEKVDGRWLASKVDAPFLGAGPTQSAPESPAPSTPAAPAPAPSTPAPAPGSSAPAPAPAPEASPAPAPAPAPEGTPAPEPTPEPGG